ncbi:hypothetical protein [Streptomyces atratus]|uniref:hypothetical protein n=1 Tax=Streptomyces atratus TaxID=1893 RepID=UPI00365FC3E1
MTINDALRIGGARLPDWRRGQTIDVSQPSPDLEEAAAPAPPVEAHVGKEKGHQQAEDAPEQDEKSKVAGDEAKQVTTAAAPARRERNSRLRWALYNGAAAAAGHLGIWAAAGDPMAGAHYMARMTISIPQLAAAAITAGAAVAGWKGAALVQLHRLPNIYGLAARPAGALAAALWGQGTAPLVAGAMSAIEPWGTLLAPLLAAGPVAAACWWGLDRNVSQTAPPVRWAARIPLATVAVSSLLYAPGALL